MSDTDWTPIILIGGIGVWLYMFKDQISGLFKGPTQVVDTTSQTLSDNIDLLNIKKDISSIGDFLSKLNLQASNTYNTYNTTNTTTNTPGATNSQGQVFGIKQGTLGLSVLSPPKTQIVSMPSSVSVSKSNTVYTNPVGPSKSVYTPSSAKSNLDIFTNPQIKNVATNLGKTTVYTQKAVSLPPTILSQLY